MKSQEDTIAVMVVYQPPEAVIQHIEALLPQVKALIVIDNGNNVRLRLAVEGGLTPPTPSATPAASRRPLGGEIFHKVLWIQSPENNLAKAQNLGIAKAQEMGAKFVLLMDDDSLPAPDMVMQLRETWHEGIAVVAPTLIEPALGRIPAFIQASGKYGYRRIHPAIPAQTDIPSDTTLDSCLRGNDVMSNLFYTAASGSLIPLSVIDKIGRMDEGLGIYFVDTEFCLRARKAGLDIIATPLAVMEHSFGKVTRHAGGITTTNHSAEARFRMFQNRKKLWYRYWKSDKGYVLFDILRSLSEVLRVLLFEQNKAIKLIAMLKGLAI